jgi:hypothetical protein
MSTTKIMGMIIIRNRRDTRPARESYTKEHSVDAAI